MRFYIEMERSGPEVALVTLRDGPRPKVGELLEDEAGDAWRVRGFRSTEVELTPMKQGTSVPKGRVLVTAA